MKNNVKETVRKVLREQMDPSFAALFAFAIVGGGVYALYKVVEEIQKSLRSKVSPLKLRLTKKDEQKTLLTAFNMNKSQTLSTDYPYFVGKKIHFQVFCDIADGLSQELTRSVGNIYFEILDAKYIVLASPRNHLRSIFAFKGKSIDTNKEYIVYLKSVGENYFFSSEDNSGEFGCRQIYLSNHDFYKHIVTIRKNDVSDAKNEIETEGLSLETNRKVVTIFFTN